MNLFNPLQLKLVLGEPQRQGLFSVFVQGAPAKILPRIQKVSHPFPSVNFDSVMTGKRTYHLPENPELGDITLDFIEGEDGAVEKWYLKWIGKIWNPDGTRNAPETYLRIVVINKLSFQGVPVGAWIYKRCTPMSLDSVDYGHGETGASMRSVTIRPEILQVPAGILANPVLDAIPFGF